ncbi:heavy-metal-associated domain-containing protein [Nocardia sp. FBN12]|uniref:heavy-metal-associated domain-containing protein n=1 Tax=Nocardia sp. FBN12 TaxID=3419766 RepID=UPI003D01A430
MATHTFEIHGMHCGSCALLIDDALEDLPGVRTTQTSRKKGRATVELDPALNSPGDIVTAITELGYTAAIVE